MFLCYNGRTEQSSLAVTQRRAERFDNYVNKSQFSWSGSAWLEREEERDRKKMAGFDLHHWPGMAERLKLKVLFRSFSWNSSQFQSDRFDD